METVSVWSWVNLLFLPVIGLVLWMLKKITMLEKEQALINLLVSEREQRQNERHAQLLRQIADLKKSIDKLVESERSPAERRTS